MTSFDVESTTRYLDVQAAPPDKVDVAVLFGGQLMDPAYLASKLYHRGIADLFVTTGALNPHSHLIEARAHRDTMIAEGVPTERIVIEDKSTNTLENVRFMLPLLAEVVEVDQIRSVVSIAKWYHCRRTMMTLKAHLPAGIRYYTATYAPPNVTKDNWPESPGGRERVLTEMEKIPRFRDWGHLVDVERVGDAYE